ncbi:MAG: phosphatase PAP2 family protein [Bacteriovoracaceae bacterium]|nr:phosphatase PAP2 family protein [Bacteriovoracaceae bacterium]
MFLIPFIASCAIKKANRNPASKLTLKEKLIKNIKSAHFWAPLGLASLIHLSKSDDKISEWAYEHKPIYGTRENAMEKSDELNTILEAQMYSSVLLIPYMAKSDSPLYYSFAKAGSGLAAYLAFKQTRDVTYYAKVAANRERPNSADRLSFPSGHSSAASAARTVTSKNLELLGFSPTTELVWNGVNTTLAAGTLWARVESKWHYPVDTLVGYSLGQLISSTIYDSLSEFDPNSFFSFMFDKDGASANYKITF